MLYSPDCAVKLYATAPRKKVQSWACLLARNQSVQQARDGMGGHGPGQDIIISLHTVLTPITH